MNPYLFLSPEVHFRGHNINFQSIHTSEDANLSINDDLMILNPTDNMQIHSFCVNKIPENGNTSMILGHKNGNPMRTPAKWIFHRTKTISLSKLSI